MADASVVKIRIDSKEYDQELRKVTAGLTEFFERARAGGASMDELEKGAMEAVQAFGKMDTAATSARGKAAELTRAFTELHVQYQQMTDAEKASPLGQEMSKSLDELRQRLESSRTQLDNATAALQGTESAGGSASGVMEQLAQKFTVNIDAIKLFSMGLTAAKGALDVAKDAFFNNEEQLDEWGRIVESSHSLYQGFLNALNTGDISGFLSNMGNIVQAARDAYDALDTLNTFNAFNQINVEKTRTSMTESIADYRMGQGTKEGVKEAGEAYKNELKERKRLEHDAYLTAVNDMAQQRGVSYQDLLDAMSGSYGHYQDLKKVQMKGTATRYTPGLLPGSQGTYTQYNVARNDQERLGEALRHLNDTELKALQALGAQAERTGNEIAQVDRSLARVLNGNRIPGGAGGGTASGTRGNGGGVTNTGTDISKAEKEYQDSLAMAAQKMDASMLTKEEYDKQVLNGQQRLADAYLKAYQKTGDDKYLSSFKEMAKHVVSSQQTIDANAKAQKEAADAAKRLAEEEKKKAQELEHLKLTQTFSEQGIGAKISDLRKAQSAAEFGSADYKAISEQIVDAESISNLLRGALQNGVDLAATGIDTKDLWMRVVSGENIDPSVWQELQDAINEQLAHLGINPIEINFNTGKLVSDAKSMTSEWKDAAGAIQAVGSAMSQIEDPAAKVMGTIAQAIATVALTFSKSLAGTVTPWDWIAAAAAGTATMITTINAIKTATAGSFADGGMVPGNNYSDGLLARVSSGEIILNKSQQNSIASQLQQRSDGGEVNSHPYVSGEMIFLGLNNYLRRSGRGEILTAK